MGQNVLDNLERLVETLIGWMGQYRFDPARVEVAFGMPDAELPARRIELANGRKLVLRRGFKIPAGEKTLVVEDVVTKGGRVQASPPPSGRLARTSCPVRCSRPGSC